MKEFVKTAMDNMKIINAYFRFDLGYYQNLIPLASNNKLFLVVNENGFIQQSVVNEDHFYSAVTLYLNNPIENNIKSENMNISPLISIIRNRRY